MSQTEAPVLRCARLEDRALVRVSGPDWRPFLQGLITQDVETAAAGDLRYGALLTPQGRLLHDLFIWAAPEAALLDVDAAGRTGLLARLQMYRLRARVEISAADDGVWALFGDAPVDALPQGGAWRRDPRLPDLGWRALGAAPPPGCADSATGEDYDALRLRLGVGDVVRDGLADKAYGVEANFDLLHGVDFKKGCFVGQETTSRMKRRGTVRTRLAPLLFEGPPPAPGTEVLTGTLRAGEVRSGGPGQALALLRLDRASGADLTADGRPVRLAAPEWLQPALDVLAPESA